MSSRSSESGGLGVCVILFLIFLVLKLTGYIAWSWWWVSAPLWMPIVIIGSLVAVALSICVVVARRKGQKVALKAFFK